jgi:hypothetical protein
LRRKGKEKKHGNEKGEAKEEKKRATVCWPPFVMTSK